MGKRSPFREGVKVRIVIPERFVRCGYNLTPMIAARILKEKHEQDIIDFLEKIGLPGLTGQKNTLLGEVTATTKYLRDHRLSDRLLGDLGYFYAGASGMGGKERKIHTMTVPEYEGMEAYISESRSVMTGEYYGPSGGYDSYSGEYDYEPGGLWGQKHNRIHRLGYLSKGKSQHPVQITTDVEDQQFQGLWFEQRCLEIIPD